MTVIPKKRLLIYTGADGQASQDLFKLLCDLLTDILEKDSYSFEKVADVPGGGGEQTKDLKSVLSSSSDKESSPIVGLILANFCSQSTLFNDDETKKLLAHYLLTPRRGDGQCGKILTFCNDLGATSQDEHLWLLKRAFPGDPVALDNVLDLFRKFSNREDIPVNRQIVQLVPDERLRQQRQQHPDGGAADVDDEFTVAVARIENSVAYLDISAEGGSEVVFVAGSLADILKQPKTVWSTLAQTIDLSTVNLFPQPAKEAVPASLETVLIYAGESSEHTEEMAEKMDAALKKILQHTRFKYQHVKSEKLRGDPTPLRKLCAAVICATENGDQDFDAATKRRLVDFFKQGGKVLFVGGGGHTTGGGDKDWTWFLSNVMTDAGLLGRVRAAFDKYSAGQRAPGNWPIEVNAASAQDHTQYDLQNYSVAMIKVDGSIPVLYVSGDDCGTVAFASAKPKDLLGQRLEIWKDLLRVIDVNVLPGQDHRFTHGRMISRVKDELIKPLPPNLFIYCETKESFQKYAILWRHVLHRDTYALYQLSPSAMTTVRWAPYCRTLFLTDSALDAGKQQLIIDYVKKSPSGGRVMYFVPDKKAFLDDASPLWLLDAVVDDKKACQDFSDRFRRFVRTNALPTNLITKPVGDPKDKNAPEHYAALLKIQNAVSVLYAAPDDRRSVAFVVGLPDTFDSYEQQDETWKDLLRILDLDVTFSPPRSLTSGYLYCKDQDVLLRTCNYLKSVSTESTPDMLFVRATSTDGSPTFPIRVKERRAEFTDDFFQKLKTRMLGEAVVFIPVARSLLHFVTCFSDLADRLGIVLVASEQVSAPNEVGKFWMSPPGAATFAFNVKIEKKSQFGQNVGFAKCLATLAAANGIKKTPAYIENSKYSPIDVGVKWPDDIFINKHIKIGSVLCKIKDSDSDHYVLSYGIGINVSNQRPTACLNDFAAAPESTSSSSAAAGGGRKNNCTFDVETVIAYVLAEMESTIDLCQKDGTASVAKLFDQSYVHLNDEVTLMNSGGKKATIAGVNFDGNLNVKLQDGGGQVVTVASDPNVELCSNSLDCLVPVVAGGAK